MTQSVIYCFLPYLTSLHKEKGHRAVRIAATDTVRLCEKTTSELQGSEPRTEIECIFVSSVIHVKA